MSDRPTMREVARAAGVSPMTVSYAYSTPDRVSAETAEKVRRAADRLGYPGPHPAARSLRQGRVGTIGVVLGEPLTYAFDDPQAARFLAGVAEVCTPEGVGITLVPITGGSSDVDRVAGAVVDGYVVWTLSDDDPVLDAVADSGLPAAVHAVVAGHGLPVVGIDDEAAAEAVGRLAFRGARRPVVLGLPLDPRRTPARLTGADDRPVPYPVTRRRWDGFRTAWREMGGAAEDLTLLACGGNHARLGEQAVAALLDEGEDPARPDVIAAMSDELAFGALRALAAAGLAVPGDVAVTGWDDGETAAAAGLTTVAQSLREQGARCARLALGLNTPEDDEPPGWELVVRRTTR